VVSRQFASKVGQALKGRGFQPRREEPLENSGFSRWGQETSTQI